MRPQRIESTWVRFRRSVIFESVNFSAKIGCCTTKKVVITHPTTRDIRQLPFGSSRDDGSEQQSNQPRLLQSPPRLRPDMLASVSVFDSKQLLKMVIERAQVLRLGCGQNCGYGRASELWCGLPHMAPQRSRVLCLWPLSCGVNCPTWPLRGSEALCLWPLRAADLDPTYSGGASENHRFGPHIVRGGGL